MSMCGGVWVERVGVLVGLYVDLTFDSSGKNLYRTGPETRLSVSSPYLTFE